MARSEKWIGGSAPGDPVSRVARRAIRTRLKTLRRYAKLAAKHAQDDIEYVHGLRVSARRAEVALQVFGELLPKDEATWIAKRIKKLRRASGDARDLDVLADRFSAFVRKRKKRGRLVKELHRLRKTAQKTLKRRYRSLGRQDFSKRCRALVKSASWRDGPEPTYVEVARRGLQPTVDQFFQAANADLSEIEALHEMRLAGKRVRYALELLSGAFDRSLRDEHYAVFREVQEKLGTINDHATAVDLISHWSTGPSGSAAQSKLICRVVANERQQLDAACAAFRVWWTPERSKDLQARFDAVIAE